jgi:hypothetical protein
MAELGSARFFVLPLILLAACTEPVAPKTQLPEDTRLTVIADAMFYYRCTHKPVQVAGECRPWLEAYQRDYAEFIAKYGRPEHP